MKSFYGTTGEIHEICADEMSAHHIGLLCKMGMKWRCHSEPKYAVVGVEIYFTGRVPPKHDKDACSNR